MRLSVLLCTVASLVVPSALLGQSILFEGTYSATAPTGPGAGTVEIAINVTGNTATYTSTFDGPVFDVTAPPEIVYTMNGTLTGDTWNFADFGHPIFGDSTLTIDNTTGQMTGTSAGIPSGGLSLVMNGMGSLSALEPGGTLDMTYDMEDQANPGTSVGSGVLNAIGSVSVIDIPTLGGSAQLLLAAVLVAISLGVLRRNVAS